MPRLSSLHEASLVTETFEYGGEQITATFDRARITLHWARVAQDVEMVPDALADVIREWNIVDDDDEPFPPTPENIAKLPMPMIQALLQALTASSVPSEVEGKNSSGPPSSPSVASAEPAATYQNGLVTSGSPGL